MHTVFQVLESLVTPIARLAHLRRQRRLTAALHAARAAGYGVFRQEWHLQGGEEHGTADWAAAIIAEWCRTTLAACRRPWGLSRFDLALAWSAAPGGGEGAAGFPRLDPSSLYTEDGIEEQIGAWLRERCAFQDGTRIEAALFSWGEALHASLEGRAA
jgi:hypothetical protein